MTGKQLKNAILQLAIQGKLVPQDANDEPASVLLAQIRQEKEQLVKAGKLKKKDLETTPITDEEKPFDIPESWEWVRLGDLASFVVDCPHSTPQKVSYKTNHPCIRTSEIKGGTIVWDSMQYLDESNYLKRIARLKPKEGDIVYAREGMYGDAVILPNTHEFCLGQRTMMLRMALRPIVEYVHKAIISPFGYSQAVSLNREGTTSVGHVNMSDIVKFIIPLPPLSEQHRIVAKIEELMPLVEAYGAAQEKLNRLNEALPEALKKSILQQAIQGKLVSQDPTDEPASVLLAQIRKEKEQLLKAGKLKKKDLETTPITDEEKPFEIPESWEWCKLQDLCYLEDGIKSKEKGILLDAKYLRGKSSAEYVQGGKLVSKGDNIILVDGENSGEVFDVPVDGIMGSTFKQLIINSVLYKPYLLMQILFYKNLFRNSKKGAAIPHLNKEIFRNLPISLPPLAEQKRIVARVEELFAVVEGMEGEVRSEK